jgi:Secretion system C-terminal sorting domain
MKPNGTANYPYDHTTGANGGTVFFSGCDTYFSGPFELQQTIDVSADAALIDLGNELYTFSGYMQTPVSNQTDEGRFIVDYLNASNTILGSSYTSSWQSYFGGSGTSWVYYNNTRIAPAGTRKIRIRMQAQILFNQPAINVYFDDIALTKPSVVPVNLLSFTGKETNDNIHLNWEITSELDLKQFELEHSTDATRFNGIATIPANKNSYHFIDYNNTNGSNFYRLKMTGIDGKISYSKIIMIKSATKPFINLSPNPASNTVRINSGFQKSIIAVINSCGQTVLTANTSTPSVTLDISRLPAGLYVIRVSDQTNSINKKLVIRPE